MPVVSVLGLHLQWNTLICFHAELKDRRHPEGIQPSLKLYAYDCSLKCRWLSRWLSGKESTCWCGRCSRCGFNPWVRKVPCRRKWQPTPVFLLGKLLRQRSLVGGSLLSHKTVGHSWACTNVSLTVHTATRNPLTSTPPSPIHSCFSAIPLHSWWHEDWSYGGLCSKSPSLPLFCGSDWHPLTYPSHTQKQDKSRNESLQGMGPSSFSVLESGCCKHASKVEALSGCCNTIWLAQQQLVRNRPKREEAPLVMGSTPSFLVCCWGSNPALRLDLIWFWLWRGPWWPVAVSAAGSFHVSLSLLMLPEICCSLEHPASPGRHPGTGLFILSCPKCLRGWCARSPDSLYRLNRAPQIHML